MDDLSQLANMAEIIGVLIVIGGLVFAVIQMRQLRQQRREMAAIELFRFFGSPEFTRAYQCVLKLPDGITTAELNARSPDLEHCAMVIGTTMENIGVMVYHRIVPSVVVRNLIGISTIVLWRKLACWVREMRERHDNPSAFEWFEWLADMLDRTSHENMPPAYEAHTDWRPSRSSQEL